MGREHGDRTKEASHEPTHPLPPLPLPGGDLDSDATNRVPLPGRELETRTANEADLTSAILTWTYRKLLSDPGAPLEGLVQVKDFAKINREHPDSALPREVATMLYYASIAAALTRQGHRISSLGDAELGEGLAWAAEQPWLDENTRTMLEGSIKLLNQSAG